MTLCLRHRLRKDPLESIDSGYKVEKAFKCLVSKLPQKKTKRKLHKPTVLVSQGAFFANHHSSANTNENLAFLVEYFNFVEPVQSTKVCRAIDVIAGNRFTGIWGITPYWPYLSLSFVIGSSVSILVREAIAPQMRATQVTAVLLLIVSIWL